MKVQIITANAAKLLSVLALSTLSVNAANAAHNPIPTRTAVSKIAPVISLILRPGLLPPLEMAGGGCPTCGRPWVTRDSSHQDDERKITTVAVFWDKSESNIPF